MTLTINMCWWDKCCNWWSDNHFYFIWGFLLMICFAGIPTFVYGVLILGNIYDSPVPNWHEKDRYNLTRGLIFYGFFASIFAIWISMSQLLVWNKKYNWIRVKHCSDIDDCDEEKRK